PLGPLVLAELAGAILVGAARRLRPGPSVLDQAIRVLGRQGFHEVGSAYVQDAVDEMLEFTGGGQRQMTLEDDTVETGEHGDNQAGKLGDEARQRLHGVLLREGPEQPLFWRQNAVFTHPLWLRLCRVGNRSRVTSRPRFVYDAGLSARCVAAARVK